MNEKIHKLFPSEEEIPAFYLPYVQAIGTFENPLKLLEDDLKRQFSLLDNCPGLDLNYSYAPGKWTLRQLINHLIDAEMVMTFRLLAAARGDTNNYLGYDHEQYAEAVTQDTRNWMELRTAWKEVRRVVVNFSGQLGDNQWQNHCIVDGYPMTAALILYIIAGHPRVHFDTIQKKYIP